MNGLPFQYTELKAEKNGAKTLCTFEKKWGAENTP
jgi:hypothetical protein